MCDPREEGTANNSSSNNEGDDDSNKVPVVCVEVFDDKSAPTEEGN